MACGSSFALTERCWEGIEPVLRHYCNRGSGLFTADAGMISLVIVRVNTGKIVCEAALSDRPGFAACNKIVVSGS